MDTDIFMLPVKNFDETTKKNRLLKTYMWKF